MSSFPFLNMYPQSEGTSPTTPNPAPVIISGSPYAESTASASVDAYPETSSWASSPEVSPAFQPFHYIPFGRNPLFVVREEFLSEMKRVFSTSFYDFAIVGLAGIGKTQVALSFAYWVRDTRPDCSVIWLTATSMDDFHYSCQELVKSFGIQDPNHQDPKTLVRNYLSTDKSRKWLLILDNVDDIKLFSSATAQDTISYFLPRNTNVRILLTSRFTYIARDAAGSRATILRLQGMTPEESVSLFLQSSSFGGQVRSRELVYDLVKELDHTPLAIMQAADYMSSHNMSISQYLKLFRGKDADRIALLEYIHVDETYHGPSRGAVAVSWRSTFEQIRKNYEDSLPLLCFITEIDSTDIPGPILPPLETESTKTEVINVLLHYGFLTQPKSFVLFDMPPLLHFVVHQWFEGFGYELRKIPFILAHMIQLVPYVRHCRPELWLTYLPHAVRICRRYNATFREASTLEMMIAVGLLNDDEDAEDAEYAEAGLSRV